MTRGARLLRRLIILCVFGIVAYLIDGWARQNANTLLALAELGVLVVWVGVDLSDIFHGALKAGPDQSPREKAIQFPLYQVVLMAYCLTLGGVALVRAMNGQPVEFLERPFLVWVIAAPVVAAGFVLEYREEGTWQET